MGFSVIVVFYIFFTVLCYPCFDFFLLTLSIISPLPCFFPSMYLNVHLSAFFSISKLSNSFSSLKCSHPSILILPSPYWVLVMLKALVSILHVSTTLWSRLWLPVHLSFYISSCWYQQVANVMNLASLTCYFLKTIGDTSLIHNWIYHIKWYQKFTYANFEVRSKNKVSLNSVSLARG